MYMLMGLIILTSVGIYYTLDVFSTFSAPKISTIFGATAINYYYLWNIPVLSSTFDEVLGFPIPMVIQYAFTFEFIYFNGVVDISHIYEGKPNFYPNR